MFVQVIEARTADPDGLRTQFDKWESELKPGARGFLGSTGGVTEDRQVIVCARFESEEAAAQNSARTEQGEWWTETQKYLLDPTFRNSTDVTVSGGPADTAGFVQVIRGRSKNPARAREMDSEFTSAIRRFRPEVLGNMTLWFENDFVNVVYFTSEDAARQSEKKEPPADLAAMRDEYRSLSENTEFLDLRDPWLRSP